MTTSLHRPATETSGELTPRETAILTLLLRTALTRRDMTWLSVSAQQRIVTYNELIALARRGLIVPDSAHPLPDLYHTYDFAFIGAVWSLTSRGAALIERKDVP